LELGARRSKKYLDRSHRERAYRGTPAPEIPEKGVNPSTPSYRAFVIDGWPELIEDGMSLRDCEQVSGINRGTLSRMMITWREEQTKEKTPPPPFDRKILRSLEDFTIRYFPKKDIPGFHLEWVDAIDEVVGNGGKLLLLAPQRHGKSEMLIRYCVMRILADPNISILWVSKTAKLAEKMVGYVRQLLSGVGEGAQICEDVLGAGRTFEPGRSSGLPWTNGEFTVNSRTQLRKTPTMVAIGTGGQILGLDADLVILDDPQDRKRCLSPAMREGDAEWFLTDFLSRKEEDTGVAFIMSRQHVEDLPGHVLRDHIDEWDVRVYRAHDPVCTIAESRVDEHTDCVLWPKKRSWSWLYGQKRENEAHFERNYQNNPQTDSTTYITAEDIDKIRDRTRRVGDVPDGCRLIAGIDPAEAKPVAATLWGFDGIHRHLIDCMEASASVVGLREILAVWPARYGVREFAFEKNMAKSWLLDTEVLSLIRSQGLKIHQHYTDRVNKQSLAIGPISMFQRMRTQPPEITIPGLKGDGWDRLERLVRTWLLFDPDWAGHKHADDDLVMASWFPQLIIDSWVKAPARSMSVDYVAFGGI
jgi:hypothetical protein